MEFRQKGEADNNQVNSKQTNERIITDSDNNWEENKQDDMKEKRDEGWNLPLASGRPDYDKEPAMEDEGREPGGRQSISKGPGVEKRSEEQKGERREC